MIRFKILNIIDGDIAIATNDIVVKKLKETNELILLIGNHKIILSSLDNTRVTPFDVMDTLTTVEYDSIYIQNSSNIKISGTLFNGVEYSKVVLFDTIDGRFEKRK